MFILILTLFLSGCDNEKIQTYTTEKEIEQAAIKPKISKNEIEERLRILSSGLLLEYDDMKNIRYYSCPYTYENSIQLLPYVAIDDDYNVQLFDRPIYIGDSWIFFNNIYIKFGEELYKNSYNDSNRKTYVGEGYVTESYDVLMSNEFYDVLNNAINSNSKIRFEGKKSKDKILSDDEKISIKKVFNVYDLFKNIEIKKEQNKPINEIMINYTSDLIKSSLLETDSYILAIQKEDFEEVKKNKKLSEKMNLLLDNAKKQITKLETDEKFIAFLDKAIKINVYRKLALERSIELIKTQRDAVELKTDFSSIIEFERKTMNEYLLEAEKLRQEFKNNYGF